MSRSREFEHLTGSLTSDEIGLGWLDGVTLRAASRAVSVKPHTHRHMEVILCLRGEISYDIDGYDPITLGADMGIVIPARRRHALNDNAESPGERLGLHLLGKMSTSRDYAIFSCEDYLDFHSRLSASAARPFHMPQSLRASARELADYLKRPGDKLTSPEQGLIRILCCSILYTLVKTLSSPLAPPRPQLMEEAVKYLKAHNTEPFHVNDLVHHMGYSRASLFTLFKRHTGLTPNDYLVRLRLDKAKQMLTATAVSIVSIATACGFRSPEYFSAVFRRYVGQTPGAYRANKSPIDRFRRKIPSCSTP